MYLQYTIGNDDRDVLWVVYFEAEDAGHNCPFSCDTIYIGGWIRRKREEANHLAARAEVSKQKHIGADRIGEFEQIGRPSERVPRSRWVQSDLAYNLADGWPSACQKRSAIREGLNNLKRN